MSDTVRQLSTSKNNRPNIANLKKRAAALGLTIEKQGDTRDTHGTGFNEYTIAATERDHDNSYMFSLEGIARLIEACETFPDASPEQIKAILADSNPLKYAGELLSARNHEREPIELVDKRKPSYPEAVLKATVHKAIASGSPIVENIPAQPAKPYESAIGTYSTPYGEGCKAFTDGVKWHENPYPGGSVESYQWDRGHTSLRAPELATAKPVHSHDLLCEAALCIWEWMLENRDGIPAMNKTWDKQGTVAMRHAAIALAPAACTIWDMMTENERETCVPYDWEFIPAFVAQVDWAEWVDFGKSALAGGVDLATVKASILARGSGA